MSSSSSSSSSSFVFVACSKEKREMAPTQAARNSFVGALPSQQKKGMGHLLSGSNGLRKTIEGETLAEQVMSISEKPKINYDKMKVRRERIAYTPHHIVALSDDVDHAMKNVSRAPAREYSATRAVVPRARPPPTNPKITTNKTQKVDN